MMIPSPLQRMRAIHMIALLVTAMTTVGCDHKHANHSSAEAHQELRLNNGAQWVTDAPLRQAMQQVKKLSDSIADEPDMPPEKAAQVAAGVMQQVTFMVNNCKLDPQADEVLHILIADLIKGANELQGASTQAHGVKRIRAVVQAFPQYFTPTDGS